MGVEPCLTMAVAHSNPATSKTGSRGSCIDFPYGSWNCWVSALWRNVSGLDCRLKTLPSPSPFLDASYVFFFLICLLCFFFCRMSFFTRVASSGSLSSSCRSLRWWRTSCTSCKFSVSSGPTLHHSPRGRAYGARASPSTLGKDITATAGGPVRNCQKIRS